MMRKTGKYGVLLSMILIFISCFTLSIYADQKYNGETREFDADWYYDVLEVCAEQIRNRTDFQPEIAVVLGSGLGDFADCIEIETEIPFSEILGFPVSTVSGHEGKLIFGTYGGRNLVVMKGRVHYYEGYSMYDVVLPVRVLSLLGADTVILTHAVGSMNPDFRPGEFVVTEDQISSFVPSPLIGENIEKIGERFTDMTSVYDPELRELVKAIGEEKGIPVHEGVFLQVTGPQYETPAEIRLYQLLGADTIGMSTAAEAIAAKHMGMRICGISCITNMAAGMEEEVLSHDLVKEAAGQSADDFTVLVQTLIERIPPADEPSQGS